MEKSSEESKKTFKLDTRDVESAIRQFICTCHPEVAKGYVINPIGGMPAINVEFEAVKS
jgi:hypothetical protein